MLDAWIKTWLAPTFKQWSLDEELKQVRCPILAIHGDQDEYRSQRHSERIVRLTSSPARVVIMSACGHVPHREQPERVLREVAQFLAPGGATSEPNL